MKTIIAVMLCSSLAYGDPPADAPLKEHVCGEREADPDARGCEAKIKKGEPAPYDGVVHDDQEYVRQTRDRAGKTGTLEKAETGYVLMPKGALAGLIVGAIVLSAAAAATVTYVALPKR